MAKLRRQRVFAAFAGLAGYALLATPTLADDEDVSEAPAFELWYDGRIRLEAVSLQSVERDATAITLRSRVGLKHEVVRGLEFVAEGENTLALQEDYNSTINGVTDRPVVPDPEGTEVNRLFLRYNAPGQTEITVGRQRLLFDNARFIGNVAWRQNEQTFDAVSLKNTTLPDTTIHLTYIDRVQRIFGPDSPNGRTDMRSPLLHVEYAGFANSTATLYGYFLDFDDAPANSNKTLGFRYKGNILVADQRRADYVFEYARQSAYKNGANSIDATYLNAGAGVAVSGFRLGANFERLSGNGNYGFQTPLATAHAFNGWADLFLTTPVDGLRDTNINLSTNYKGVRFRAVYHRFEADRGGARLGSEFNVIAARKFGNNFAGGIKFADYTAREFGVDTTKFWMWVGITY